MKRHPVALAAVLSALYAALPLAVCALRFGVIAPIYLFAGDAFYYLDIAKRSQRVPGFTFDGEHPTNGFHPLGEWLLYGLGRVGVLDFRQTEGVLLRVYWVNLLLLAAGAGVGCGRRWRRTQWAAGGSRCRRCGCCLHLTRISACGTTRDRRTACAFCATARHSGRSWRRRERADLWSWTTA